MGGALLFFQEIDTALEVAGLFAAGQFAVRRLLFAEDRKQTANEIKCAQLPFSPCDVNCCLDKLQALQTITCKYGGVWFLLPSAKPFL